MNDRKQKLYSKLKTKIKNNRLLRKYDDIRKYFDLDIKELHQLLLFYSSQAKDLEKLMNLLMSC